MKKLLSLFTVGVLMLSFLSPFCLSAAEVTEGSLGGDTYWTFDETTGELTVYGTGATGDYYCEATDVLNDSTMTFQYVTSFPKPDFYSLKEKIKIITVEEGISKLGRGLFREIALFTTVSLPESLNTIDSECFCLCTSLTDIVLPESLTKIGSGAFDRCVSLERLVWPPKVEVIEKATLAGCENLNEFTIPSTVTRIECFAGGTNIKKLFIPNTVTLTEYALHAIRSEEIIIENGVTRLPALLSSNAYLKRLVIPKSVEYIEPGFFGTYNSFDFQICYTGTQEELDTLFSNLDPVLVDHIKMREVVTDYIVDYNVSTNTMDNDTSIPDTTIDTNVKETKFETSSDTTKTVGNKPKDNESLSSRKIIIIAASVGTVIVASTILIVVIVKKKKEK